MGSPSLDIFPISGYATFYIAQYNYTIPLLTVRDDSIIEPTEVIYPTILNMKGSGRILPVEGTATLSILASETGNGKLYNTVTYQKYLYRPKFPPIFLHIYLLIIESTH